MPQDADLLVGRDTELGLLRSFLLRTESQASALLLTGDAGVGKTALIDAACDVAVSQQMRVLRAAGVEFEAEVSFAALHQLLLTAVTDFPTLPDLHREALAVALGLRSGPMPERLILSTAALALLSSLAEERPVLVVVDDLQWLDQATAGVLGFIARRLTDT